MFYRWFCACAHCCATLGKAPSDSNSKAMYGFGCDDSGTRLLFCCGTIARMRAACACGTVTLIGRVRMPPETKVAGCSLPCSTQISCCSTALTRSEQGPLPKIQIKYEYKVSLRHENGITHRAPTLHPREHARRHRPRLDLCHNYNLYLYLYFRGFEPEGRFTREERTCGCG